MTSTAETTDPTVGVLSGFTRLAAAGGVGLPVDSHDDDLRVHLLDQRAVGRRPGRAGPPEVTLDSPATGRVVVKLTHVDPAGRSVFITSGHAR